YVCSGYPTGSGLPMQFVDQAGAIVPVYQQVTELVDEMMMTGIATNYCNLTQAQAVTESQGLIDRSLAGFYSAVTLQAHTDYQMTQWLDGTLAYAQSKGVPI